MLLDRPELLKNKPEWRCVDGDTDCLASAAQHKEIREIGRVPAQRPLAAARGIRPCTRRTVSLISPISLCGIELAGRGQRSEMLLDLLELPVSLQ
jgi:hypothetical protein